MVYLTSGHQVFISLIWLMNQAGEKVTVIIGEIYDRERIPVTQFNRS